MSNDNDSASPPDAAKDAAPPPAGRSIGWAKSAVIVVATVLTAIFGIVLFFANVMSDKLSESQTLVAITAADKPCRAAYETALDLQGDPRRTEEFAKAVTDGAAVCRSSFDALDKINIYVDDEKYPTSRLKRDAIRQCAALSKARADVLAGLAARKPAEPSSGDKLEGEVDAADKACRIKFDELSAL